MKVYRCCGDEELAAYQKGEKCIKAFGSGTNTFNYGNEKGKYVHFFLFAESMYHYYEHKKGRYTKHFIECDIPFELLKKYYGYGWYEAVIPGFYTPVPEFAIPVEEFDVKSICSISDEMQDAWLRPDDWNKYKNNIPREYLANYFSGCFLTPGYDEFSILEVPMEDLIGHMIDESFHM